MGYLYKLVEIHSLNDAKNNIISFTRPFFNYDYEGNFIKFAKSISQRFDIEKENIKPNDEDLKELKTWIKAFKENYGKEVSDYDLLSDSQIIFCRILCIYCGYFTQENLFDKNIRDKYISENQELVKNHTNANDDKIAVIRIKDEAIKDTHYASNSLNDRLEPFIKSQKYEYISFKGYSKTLDVKYTEKFDDYNELFSRYCKNDYFDTKVWIDVLPKDKENEKEHRISFSLKGLTAHNSIAGCDSVFKPNYSLGSLELQLFKRMIDALIYAKSENVPNRIYLKLKSDEIDIIDLEDNPIQKNHD